MAKRLANSAESGMEETRAAIRRAEAMLGWARQQLDAPMPVELDNFHGGSVGAEQLDQLLRQLIHFRRKVLVRAWTLEVAKQHLALSVASRRAWYVAMTLFNTKAALRTHWSSAWHLRTEEWLAPPALLGIGT